MFIVPSLFICPPPSLLMPVPVVLDNVIVAPDLLLMIEPFLIPTIPDCDTTMLPLLVRVPRLMRPTLRTVSETVIVPEFDTSTPEIITTLPEAVITRLVCFGIAKLAFTSTKVVMVQVFAVHCPPNVDVQYLEFNDGGGLAASTDWNGWETDTIPASNTAIINRDENF